MAAGLAGALVATVALQPRQSATPSKTPDSPSVDGVGPAATPSPSEPSADEDSDGSLAHRRALRRLSLHTSWPFDTAEAKRRQQHAAEVLGLPATVKVKLPEDQYVQLVLIPPGHFIMGSPEAEPSRGEQEDLHGVVLTEPFYMSVYEITRRQFEVFTNATDYKTEAEEDGFGMTWSDAADAWEKKKGLTWREPDVDQVDDHPVVFVTWGDAQAFVKWLSSIDQRTYRLPREAEWEYACRAGSEKAFHTGKTITSIQANLNGTVSYDGGPVTFKRDNTMSVGKLPSNAWGLFGMHGNVHEWVIDRAGRYPRGITTNPTGPSTGDKRTVRGGAWSEQASDSRSAYRSMLSPTLRTGVLGFRIVLEAASMKFD